MKSSRAKKFLSLVLAVVMVLALAACGNKTNDDSNTNNDNNSATDFPTKPMTIVCPYGAGGGTDGQVLVIHDMLGINKGFSPRFLRRYADLHTVMTDAVGRYVADVKSQDFPNEQEQY